jgi:hypothetical protein
VSAQADDFAQRGDRLFDEGRLADALGQYQGAWARKRTHEIAGNLGAVELELGRHRDAAEHLAWSLRRVPRTTPDPRLEALKASLDQARSHVAALTPAVGVEGAEIRVDGRVVGATPLEGEIFVEPGTHLVEAVAPGFVPTRLSLAAEAGAAVVVVLALAPVPPPPAPAPPAPVLEAQPRRDDLVLRLAAIGVLAAVVLTLVARKRAAAPAQPPVDRRQVLLPGARRRGRFRRWVRRATRVAAGAITRRLRERADHPREVLPPAFDGGLFDRRDLAPLGAAYRALNAAVPRAEAMSEALARLRAPFAKHPDALRREKLLARMRESVTTALDALHALEDIERHLRGRGDAPVLANQLDAHLWQWLWQTYTLRDVLARENAVVALEEAGDGLTYEEEGLIAETVGGTRTALTWIRRMIATAAEWGQAPGLRDHTLRDLHRELAAVFWELDVLTHVEQQLRARLTPPPASPLDGHGLRALARLARRAAARARDAMLLRRRRWRRALEAVSDLRAALRAEAEQFQKDLRGHRELPRAVDPRLPPPEALPPSPEPAADTSAPEPPPEALPPSPEPAADTSAPEPPPEPPR